MVTEDEDRLDRGDWPNGDDVTEVGLENW